MSKKPKLYDTGPPASGSSTMMALWPKRSKNTSPGCIVATPTRIRVAAGSAVASSSHASASRTAARKPRLRSGFGQHRDIQGMQPARVGAGDAEGEAAEGQFLSHLGQVADRRGDQAADGVVFVVVEVGAEAFV